MYVWVCVFQPKYDVFERRARDETLEIKRPFVLIKFNLSR